MLERQYWDSVLIFVWYFLLVKDGMAGSFFLKIMHCVVILPLFRTNPKPPNLVAVSCYTAMYSEGVTSVSFTCVLQVICYLKKILTVWMLINTELFWIESWSWCTWGMIIAKENIHFFYLLCYYCFRVRGFHPVFLVLITRKVSPILNDRYMLLKEVIWRTHSSMET